MSLEIKNHSFLHHLSMESPNPEDLANFYSNTLGMNFKKYIHQNKTIWMCFGNDRRLLFVEGEKKKLNFAGFSCRNESELKALYSKYKLQNIDTFNYDDLVKLYEILKNDDDKIFKWYSGIGHKDLLPLNNVSKLLKEFKIE